MPGPAGVAAGVGLARRAGPLLIGIGLAIVFAFIAFLMIIAAILGGRGCDVGGSDPSAAARKDIPSDYLSLMQAAERKYGIRWSILAGIASVETNFGRSTQPGVRSGVNTYGCCAGPMQFNIKNGPRSTWDAYKVDGNGDGKYDVYDPRDAIPAAANYLKSLGGDKDVRKAIFGYNHAGWYVEKVLAQARAYEEAGATLVGPASINAGCDDGGGLLAGGTTGDWTLAAGANRPGVDLSPLLRRFIDRMAGVYPGRLVVTTGTSHNQFSSSGNVSDHWDGNGADFGMVVNGGADDSPVGDRIAAAALVVMGTSREEAMAKARAGGAITIVKGGLRLQVIWKSNVGGNHHNHVHVGVRRVG